MTAGLEGTFYLGSDGDLGHLRDKKVAVVGYGNLGRSVALNLRDSGVSTVVGSRQDDSADLARADGFAVLPIDEAVAAADVVWFLLPDEVLPEVLARQPAAAWRPGALACFSSGYVLSFGLIDIAELPVDVVLLAPRMVGAEVRRCYLDQHPFFAYIGVEREVSGAASLVLLALCRAAGGDKIRLLAMPAREEARLDLYIEQSVGPILGMAVLTAFEVGLDAGLPAEALAAELYASGEMARTWQAFADDGFFRAVELHGGTARYGGYLRSGDVDVAGMRRRFVKILEEISDGTFARWFQAEEAAGWPTFRAIDAFAGDDNALTLAERRLADAFAGPDHPVVRDISPAAHWDGQAAAAS